MSIAAYPPPARPVIDPAQLDRAYRTARNDLLARRDASGHWIGHLCSSPLATATAASALALYARHTDEIARGQAATELARRAVDGLTGCQQEDGGWGDTDRSFSNIATTILARAAIRLCTPEENPLPDHHAHALHRAGEYVERAGGISALRARYGRDKTFAVPILTNAALAGQVRWEDVPPLPFEAGALPHSWLRLVRLPVVSYAIPALVAIGQARYFHRRPRNPITWALRRASVQPSMRRLTQMQPASGGYLEAIPLTAFVVMSLASTGRVGHPVARRGVKFLFDTVREDASWPIDTNLATWNTTQAVGALASATGEVGALGCLDWLLECQHAERHPFTDTAPGGWAWSDTSGAVPDVDDTAGALLALAVLRKSASASRQPAIERAAEHGVEWLLSLQNRDGGWPTFCRGWGALPFDRSGADLTAHALRALRAWRSQVDTPAVREAIERGLDHLASTQRPDGSWVPLWFGNQHHPDEENPVYGTARVLTAYRDLGQMRSDAARRGVQWLATSGFSEGGWGCGVPGRGEPSVEETALAIEALLAAGGEPHIEEPLADGLQWLADAVDAGRHHHATPIGFYFARLWYHESLYPLIFSVSALGRAVRQRAQ